MRGRAVVAVVVMAAWLLLTIGAASAAGSDLILTNQGNAQLTPGGTSNVAAFTIGAGGSLTSLTGSPFTLPGGGYPYGAAVTPDTRFLYVDDQVNSVYPYALGAGSPSAGAPVSIGSGSPVPVLDLVSPNGRRLYVLSLTGLEVSGFAIAGDGTLTPLPGSPYPVTVSMPESMVMTPDGAHVYVAGFTTADKLEGFNVTGDGSLSALTVSPYTLGNSTNGMRITPDGAYLYASNIDTTTPLSIFALHSDGTLSAITPPTPPPGLSPGAPRAISRDGQRLYLAENDGTILGYTIAADGTLTPLTGSPYAAVPSAVSETMWDLEFTPDGKELYVAAAPSNGSSLTADGEIATFDVGAGGALTMQAGTVDTGGTEPYQQSMTVSPDPGPVAAVTTTPAVAGAASSFSASGSHATDALYGPLVYDWSFGDGTVATGAGPSPTHVYATAGTYTATVTVTDGAGCSVALVWTGLNSFCASDPAAAASAGVAVPPAAAAPPSPHTTAVTFGNQRITLTTPSFQTCTAQGHDLAASLSSVAIRSSRAAKLKFVRAAFYLDRGVKRTRTKTTKTHTGKPKTVRYTFYAANTVEHRVPVTVVLPIAGLKTGTHTLTVTVSYQETKRKHGPKLTVTVLRALTAKFKVC
jgi:6-phosphogluconolactonase (cycloisomerase 2 family)